MTGYRWRCLLCDVIGNAPTHDQATRDLIRHQDLHHPTTPRRYGDTREEPRT